MQLSMIHQPYSNISLFIVSRPVACLHIDCMSEAFAGVDGVLTQLLFDAKNLVELGKSLTTAWSTGFL